LVPRFSDAECLVMAQELLEELMLFNKGRGSLFFKQVLRICATKFFGRDLSVWLRKEMDIFINDHDNHVSYEDIFECLVSFVIFGIGPEV
jgi:hypothetical protein